MGIAYIEYSGSTYTTSTDCVIPRPTNLAVGNLMLAHIAYYTAAISITPPTGWTEVKYERDYGRSFCSGLWYKIADSSDVAASDFTFVSPVSGPNRGAISTFSGFDTANPIGASSILNTAPAGGDSPMYFTTITPDSEYSMIAMFASNNGPYRTYTSYTITTSDPGMSEKYDLDNAESVGIGMACSIRPESTATGTGTATFNEAGTYVCYGIMVSINPEPVLIGYLTIEINGSNTKNHFIPVYAHAVTGYNASNRDFWGCIYEAGDLSNLTEDGFLSMSINSNTYWLHVYTADAVECDCCTNLEGTFRDV